MSDSMRLRARVIMAVAALVGPPPAVLAADFSLVGEWEDTQTTPGCPYRLSFNAAGQLSVMSGQERLQATYTYSRLMGPRPIGRVERVITQSNRKPDCDGRVITYTQDPQPAFVFLEANDAIQLCFDAQGKRCFARLVRR